MKQIQNLFIGRINRKTFLAGFVIYVAVILTYFIGVVVNLDPDSNFAFIHMIVIFLGVSYAISLYVRRLHDTGNSGLLALLLVLPLVNLCVFLFAAIKEGENKKNKYGPKPLSSVKLP